MFNGAKVDNLITDKNLIVDKSKLNFELKSKVVLKVVDEIWLSTIESILPALDRALRKPTRFIKETDKILPIEQSKNITARSIQDLSAHSSYIKKGKNNKLIPSKILNVFRDETIETYENRFLNTLVNRLYVFVDKRYKTANLMTVDSQSQVLDIDTIININGKNCKAKINVELDGVGESVDLDSMGENASISRIKRLHSIASSYLHSQICTALGTDFVRPPIQKTNALLKNPDLRQCLALWEFIEGYNNVGYEAISQENILVADENFVDEMLKTVSLQCATFYSLVHADTFETLNSGEETFKPKYSTDDIVQDVSVFDLRDTIYKNLLSVIDSVARKEDVVNIEKEDEIREAMQLAIEKGVLEEEKLLSALRAGQRKSESKSLQIKGSGLDRSFMSKLIQSTAEIQDFYAQIKNHVLSFKGVKNRLSWKHELINKGRTKLAYLYFAGRTLMLSLALNPAEFDVKTFHHKDLSNVKKYELVPFGLRIKSKLALKNALKLIDILMANNQIAFAVEQKEKYKYAYRTDERLIKDGLIKVRDSSLVKQTAPADGMAQEVGFGAKFKYKRSFLSKIIQLDESKKDYYNAIKNEILSRKKVKSRISWAFESFNLGRNKLAKFVVKGKTLCLCLALDPNGVEQSKYHQKDQRDVKSMQDTPLLIKLKSDRSVKNALELVNLVLDNLGAIKFDKAFENFKLPFETDSALIKKGLIKINQTHAVQDDGLTTDNLTADDLPETQVESVDESVDESVVNGEEIQAEVAQTDSVITVTEQAEQTEFVAEPTETTDDSQTIIKSKYSLVIDEPLDDEEEQSQSATETDESQPSDFADLTDVGAHKTFIADEFVDFKTNVSEYDSVFKKYSKEEIDGVIALIKSSTASSVIDQVKSEILIAYKSLCMQNLFTRRKFHKMLTCGDVEKVVFAKDELIKFYFKKIKKNKR